MATMTAEEFKRFVKSPMYVSFKTEISRMFNEDYNRFLREACDNSVNGAEQPEREVRLSAEALQNGVSPLVAINQARLIAGELSFGASVNEGSSENDIAKAYNLYTQFMNLCGQFNRAYDESLEAFPDKQKRLLEMGRKTLAQVADWDEIGKGKGFGNDVENKINSHAEAKNELATAQNELKEAVKTMPLDMAIVLNSVGEENGEACKVTVTTADILTDYSFTSDCTKYEAWKNRLDSIEANASNVRDDKLKEQSLFFERKKKEIDERYREEINELVEANKQIETEIKTLSKELENKKPFHDEPEYKRLMSEAEAFKSKDTKDISKRFVTIKSTDEVTSFIKEDDYAFTVQQLDDVENQIRAFEQENRSHMRDLEKAEEAHMKFKRENDLAFIKAEELSTLKNRVALEKDFVENPPKFLAQIDDSICNTVELIEKKKAGQECELEINNNHRRIDNMFDFPKDLPYIKDWFKHKADFSKLSAKGLEIPWQTEYREPEEKTAFKKSDFDELQSYANANKGNRTMDKLAELAVKASKRREWLVNVRSELYDKNDKASKMAKELAEKEIKYIDKYLKKIKEPFEYYSELDRQNSEYKRIRKEITDIVSANLEKDREGLKPLETEARKTLGLKYDIKENEIVNDDNRIIDSKVKTLAEKKLINEEEKARKVLRQDEKDLAFLKEKRALFRQAKSWAEFKRNDTRIKDKERVEFLQVQYSANKKIGEQKKSLFEQDKQLAVENNTIAVEAINSEYREKADVVNADRKNLKSILERVKPIVGKVDKFRKASDKFAITAEALSGQLRESLQTHLTQKQAAVNNAKQSISDLGNLFVNSSKVGANSPLFNDVASAFEGFTQAANSLQVGEKGMDKAKWNNLTDELLEKVNAYIGERQHGFAPKKTKNGQIRLDLAVRLRNELEASRAKVEALNEQTKVFDKYMPKYAEPKTSLEICIEQGRAHDGTFKEQLLTSPTAARDKFKLERADRDFFKGTPIVSVNINAPKQQSVNKQENPSISNVDKQPAQPQSGGIAMGLH